jgi:hypothetical protein
MPTTIYDSSLLTQRKRDKVISNSFITRTQQHNTVGFPPLLGISEQSSINNVKMGNMTYFTKNSDGKVIVNGGCPCPPNPVIQNIIRGFVTNIIGTSDTYGTYGGGLSNDIYGNIYVTGYFDGAGNININNYNSVQNGQINVSLFGTLSASGSNNTYLVKYNSEGTALWATRIEGTSFIIGLSTCTDSNGDVYIVGQFSSQITITNFVSVTSGIVNVVPYGTLSNGGGTDSFLIKYSSSGNVLWATTITGLGDQYANVIKADSQNNIYLCGSYNTQITINNSGTAGGGGPILVTPYGTLTNTGGFDGLIIKYNSSGTALWATNITGIGDSFSTDISVDTSNNVYIITESNSSPTIINSFVSAPGGGGPISVIAYGTFNTSNIDLILTKYNSSGTVLWATNIIGTGDQYTGNIEADPLGNIYVCLRSDQLITINNFQSGGGGGPISVIQYGTLTNIGLTNTNLVKYNSSGTALWATNIAGIANEFENSLATDLLGNLYVTGNYNSSNLLVNNFQSVGGGGTIITTQFGALLNTGAFDAFLVKYNSSGTALWATSVGGVSNENSSNVTTDLYGNVYITGSYSSIPTSVNYFESVTSGVINTATFGTLTSTGPNNLFLIKYTSEGKI